MKLLRESNNDKLIHIQIPNKLDYMYYDRKIEDEEKPSQCFSALVSPILYGPNLIVCTHWKKIKDIEESHYGEMKGKVNELEHMLHNERAERIREKIPQKCSSCCSIYDNLVLEMIRSQLAIVRNINEIEFLLTY